MSGSLLIVFLAALLGAGPQSPSPPSSPERNARAGSNTVDTPHVTITTSVKAGTPAGGRVALLIDVTPKPKMHVYSPLQKDYIPVSVTLKADPAYRAHQPVFPTPEKFFFAPLKETQLVYSKPFRIVQEVTLSSPSGGAMTIDGTFRYQACDDAICYLPKTVPVSWTIAVKASSMQ